MSFHWWIRRWNFQRPCEPKVDFLKRINWNLPVVRDWGLDVLGKSFKIFSKLLELGVRHSCDDRQSWRWWRSKPSGDQRCGCVAAIEFSLLILMRMTRASPTSIPPPSQYLVIAFILHFQTLTSAGSVEFFTGITSLVEENNWTRLVRLNPFQKHHWNQFINRILIGSIGSISPNQVQFFFLRGFSGCKVYDSFIGYFSCPSIFSNIHLKF